jgi:FMN phosphatase YigB (HAD superfamily)
MAYKPRKEMFEKALSLVDLRAQEVLHVGDSRRSDVRGAKYMKIPVLWVNRRGKSVSSSDLAPDFVATDLTGLLNILSGR